VCESDHSPAKDHKAHTEEDRALARMIGGVNPSIGPDGLAIGWIVRNGTRNHAPRVSHAGRECRCKFMTGWDADRTMGNNAVSRAGGSNGNESHL
jgi:hypothetical protein